MSNGLFVSGGAHSEELLEYLDPFCDLLIVSCGIQVCDDRNRIDAGFD
jgi:hypothetical protein